MLLIQSTPPFTACAPFIYKARGRLRRGRGGVSPTSYGAACRLQFGVGDSREEWTVHFSNETVFSKLLAVQQRSVPPELYLLQLCATSAALPPKQILCSRSKTIHELELCVPVHSQPTDEERTHSCSSPSTHQASTHQNNSASIMALSKFWPDEIADDSVNASCDLDLLTTILLEDAASRDRFYVAEGDPLKDFTLPVAAATGTKRTRTTDEDHSDDRGAELVRPVGAPHQMPDRYDTKHQERKQDRTVVDAKCDREAAGGARGVLQLFASNDDCHFSDSSELEILGISALSPQPPVEHDAKYEPPDRKAPVHSTLSAATRERRRRAIARYLAKRARRNWATAPMYSSRTGAAHKRVRTNGRFVQTSAGFFSATSL